MDEWLRDYGNPHKGQQQPLVMGNPNPYTHGLPVYLVSIAGGAFNIATHRKPPWFLSRFFQWALLGITYRRVM